MKNIKCNITKIMTVLVAFSLLACLFTVQDSQAATIRLNKRSASILEGKSIRLSVNGTKKTVKWSSSNSSVASVSKGKVTGKKPGKTVITAKVSGKTLKCSVTVKYNASLAEKNIKSSVKDLYGGILVKYTNHNKYPVSIKASLSYRDAVKTVISEESDHNYCLEAGKSTWLYFPKPTDSNYKYINYTDYKLKISTDISKYKGYTKDITQWCKPNKLTLDVTTYNYSGKNLTAAKISCLLCDSKGRVIGYMAYFPGCLQKGTHSEEHLNYPSYMSSPAQVKSYVDYAY